MGWLQRLVNSISMPCTSCAYHVAWDVLGDHLRYCAGDATAVDPHAAASGAGMGAAEEAVAAGKKVRHEEWLRKAREVLGRHKVPPVPAQFLPPCFRPPASAP